MFTFWRLGYKKIDDARRPPYCGSPWPATLDTPRLWTPAFCDFGPPLSAIVDPLILFLKNQV